MKLLSFAKHVVIDFIFIVDAAVALPMFLGYKKVVLYVLRNVQDAEERAKAITLLNDDIEPGIVKAKKRIKLAAKDLVGL